MSFDQFVPLNGPLGDKKFIAIDVYTRFPVTYDVVRCFSFKINPKALSPCLIFARNVDDKVTRKASYLCYRCNISFVTLEEMGIDYEKIKEEKSILAQESFSNANPHWIK